MRRILKLEQGIISGDTVRDILETFPGIDSKFKQRKKYDEYYYDGGVIIEITIPTISHLNQLGYRVIIDWEEVILS